MGATATTAMAVVQLGLAMMPWCFRASGPFTSGTTSGTSTSYRKALLLSMTIAPFDAHWCARALLTLPPAEASTMSASIGPSGVTCTVNSCPPNGRVFPALRGEAYNCNSSIFRLPRFWDCSSTCISSCPTAPVAPTIATRIIPPNENRPRTSCGAVASTGTALRSSGGGAGRHEVQGKGCGVGGQGFASSPPPTRGSMST